MPEAPPPPPPPSDDESLADLTRAHLRLLAITARRNPQRVAGVVRAVASELETSTGAVVRAIASAAGTAAGTSAQWARTAESAVMDAIANGSLVTSEAVAAGVSASATAGGSMGWFGGLSFAAKAMVVGAMVGGLAVAGHVTGAVELGFLTSGPQDGYQAVGVYSGDAVSIVSVRSTEAIEAGIAPCVFRHGGTDCDSDADVRPLVPDVFADPTAATSALCELLGGPRFAPRFAAGWSVPYEDGTVTLDDWGSVDFATCDAVLEG